jgi:serine phosphatase RsbU (regulator of sigma subunit)
LERHADLPVEAIRDRVMQEINVFVEGQPQHDDITMIVLKVGAGGRSTRDEGPGTWNT